MLLLAVCGFIYALLNGIPMHTATVDNDGYNVISIRRSSKAINAFWVQMKINSESIKSVRLKDMPSDWFAVPSDEDMKNSLIAAIGVFACNRLMDMAELEEADRLMAHLLEIESSICGLHRGLLICDRIYAELVSENRPDIIGEMLTAEQIKFIKSMKDFPSVIRTEYSYVLLHEKDTEKAGNILAGFEKRAVRYPYQCDILFERELIAIAQSKAI